MESLKTKDNLRDTIFRLIFPLNFHIMNVNLMKTEGVENERETKNITTVNI